MDNPKEFGTELATIVKGHIDKMFGPLLMRMDAIEALVKDMPTATQLFGEVAPELTVLKSSITNLNDRIEETRKELTEAVAAIPAPKDGEPGKDGKDGQDGTSVTLEDIRPLVASAVAAIPLPKDGQDGAPGKDGADGRDADPLEVAEMVKTMVTEAVAAIPSPKDGQDGTPGEPGKDADPSKVMELVLPVIKSTISELVAEIPQPKDGKDGADGKDADVEAVATLVVEQSKDVVAALADEIRQVRETVSALPTAPEPMDKDAIVAEVRALIPDPQPGKDGAPGEIGPKGDKGDPGADGIGLAGAIIDRHGELVVTLTNGEAKTLGPVIGKDGAPGENGKDGQDGLGWEDMDEALSDDGRTVIRRYVHGDKIKEFRHKFAIPLDRGVYKDDTDYEKGDMVSWAGSSWIAQKDNKGQKPDSAGGCWRLAVKRGRDGKDGKDGGSTPPPPPKVKI